MIHAVLIDLRLFTGTIYKKLILVTRRPFRHFIITASSVDNVFNLLRLVVFKAFTTAKKI
jgi:hypothetical protein